MGPPAGNHADSIRDKKLEFFKAMRTADPKRYVRGQYEGFRDVKDVAPDSTTETFAAVELEIDNWRWSGVPFFIRAGKCMPVKASEVTVVFKRPPRLGIGPAKHPEPNQMTVRIEPDARAPGIRLFAKKAGEEAFEPADLEVLFEKVPGEEPEPYERLLGDAIAGDQPALHPPGHGRGDLADRRSRCSTSRARCTRTSPAPGGRRRRTA